MLREAAELHEPTYNYYAQPLEENLFEWHFTIRGPEDTVFENGKCSFLDNIFHDVYRHISR